MIYIDSSFIDALKDEVIEWYINVVNAKIKDPVDDSDLNDITDNERDILNFIYQKREEIICYNINDMIDFIENINSLGYNDIIRRKISHKVNEWFPYIKFRDKFAHEFLLKSKVKTCPYCNRSYISEYKKNKNSRSSGQLDHFFAKSIHPYFSISLYNLIPSCPVCNSIFKKEYDNSQNDGMHFFPYHKQIDFNVFDFKIRNSETFESEEGFDIFINENRIFMKASNHVFNLEELYKTHKNVIVHIYKLYKLLQSSKIDELHKLVQNDINDVRKDILDFVDTSLNNGIDGLLSKLISEFREYLE